MGNKRDDNVVLENRADSYAPEAALPLFNFVDRSRPRVLVLRGPCSCGRFARHAPAAARLRIGTRDRPPVVDPLGERERKGLDSGGVGLD